MSSDRIQPACSVATRPATREPATDSTACRGTAADTSPDELSLLADQVTDLRRPWLLLRGQDAVDQVLRFMKGQVITTVLVFALLAAALALLG